MRTATLKTAAVVGVAVIALTGISSAVGCSSDYRTQNLLPDDCEREWYFEDQDGDGWGRADGAAEYLCSADDEGGLTARNNLDCDDGENGAEVPEAVTGRTNAICPDELVPGGAAFLGFDASGSEYVAVFPTLDFSHVGDSTVETTELMWAEGAASACGANGWGGSLATFMDDSDQTAVTQALDAKVGDNGYAAWIGLVPNDAEDGWRWEGMEDGEGLDPSGIPRCDPQDAPSPSDVAFDPGLRLALVKPAGGEDWCLGYPSDANPDDLGEDDFAYTDRDANFLCEREPPQASEFTVDLGTDAGASDTDSE